MCTNINSTIMNNVGKVLLFMNNEYEYANCPGSANQNEKLGTYTVFVFFCTVHKWGLQGLYWLYSLTAAERKGPVIPLFHTLEV